MLRLNIARLVRQRGRQLPQTYLVLHGFTRNEARSIMNPKLRTVKLSTLTRLCELFKVRPSALFAHSGKAKSHLDALNEVQDVRTDDLLEGLSPEEIAELARQAEAMRKRKQSG